MPQEFKQILVDRLISSLPNLTFLKPSSPGYSDHRIRWSIMWHNEPGLIVLPTSVEEISTVVDFARSHCLDLAVCSGGHGQLGSSSTVGGILISLSRLSSVSVDPANKIARVQGGAKWGSVYPVLEEHGLGIVGGVANSVGVGGVSCTAGFGWLTGRHGLSIDNILSVEMVLANGQIVTASPAENEDLFWGVRGAGACLGIVTCFEFNAHEQKEMCWMANLAFGREAIPLFLQVVDRILAGEGRGDCSASMRWGPATETSEPVISVELFHNGPEEIGKLFFASLLAVDHDVISMGVKSLSQCGFDTPPSLHKRQIPKDAPHLAGTSAEYMYRLYDEFLCFQRQENFKSTTLAWVVHDRGKVTSIGQQETAFANRGNFGDLIICPTWDNETEDEAGMAWAEKIRNTAMEEFERVKRNTEGFDEGTRSAVGEYAPHDGRRGGAKYIYGVNFDRLVEVKRRYDPGNMFYKFVDLLSE
ncbi:hypothetical protein LZ554_000594 [Drepanopeziza brunnea f. sp. 'monogermtubi']|nr:hypothetical protein LZ554_000594 [Drepanopeziza brunnea f. sp. 'monogermtubi']